MESPDSNDAQNSHELDNNSVNYEAFHVKKKFHARAMANMLKKTGLKDSTLLDYHLADETIDEEAVLNDEDLDEKNETEDFLNGSDIKLVKDAQDKQNSSLLAPKKLILKRNMESLQDEKERETQSANCKGQNLTANNSSSNSKIIISTENGFNGESAANKKIKLNLSDLNEKERIEMRIKKFGAISESAKKMLRAERFGVNSGSKQNTTVDVLKKRAERFGSIVSPTLEQVLQQEKLQKRKEKFALNNGTVKNTNRTIKLK